MEETQNDFDSVQWTRRDEEQNETSANTPTQAKSTKSSGKRKTTKQNALPKDRNADAADLAGIGADGYLMCTVEKPQKENDGTKDAFVSYLISTQVIRCVISSCRSLGLLPSHSLISRHSPSLNSAFDDASRILCFFTDPCSAAILTSPSLPYPTNTTCIG